MTFPCVTSSHTSTIGVTTTTDTNFTFSETDVNNNSISNFATGIIEDFDFGFDESILIYLIVLFFTAAIIYENKKLGIPTNVLLPLVGIIDFMILFVANQLNIISNSVLVVTLILLVVVIAYWIKGVFVNKSPA